MSARGVLIVIDGTDGSGKATQTKLLTHRLQTEGLPVQTMAFPRYGTPHCAPVEAYLAGDHGSAEEVGPYRASVFFAIDRFAASKQLHTWLEEGVCVIADRYVGSNMGHQGAKIADLEERQRFYEWNDHFEHVLFGIPRPTLNVVLHVPVEITQALMRNRQTKGVKGDIHESDEAHLRAAEQAYLHLVDCFEEFVCVRCAQNNTLLPREVIHEQIWQHVAPLIQSIS